LKHQGPDAFSQPTKWLVEAPDSSFSREMASRARAKESSRMESYKKNNEKARKTSRKFGSISQDKMLKLAGSDPNDLPIFWFNQ
jgi:hypothetical protein